VITLQRFASNGVSLLPAHGVTFSGIACEPTVAWDGEAYGIAWQTLCGQPGSEMAFELVDKSADRLAPDGTVCPVSQPGCGSVSLAVNGMAIESSPEIVWAGDHSFGVVWTEVTPSDAGEAASDVYFSRVDCM
jgi:hypothetical protein